MRRGLGYGGGKGYYNLAPLDHHIHSLSAKGVKTYYHVTLQKNLKPILKKGLLLEHKKNVKLSKKVNYVMDNLLDAGYFASKMKWEMEEQPIILQLNLTKAKIFDDKNTGAYSTWKEYHADIKPKQIKKVIHVTPEFWKGHMKRMDKKYEKATLGAKSYRGAESFYKPEELSLLNANGWSNKNTTFSSQFERQKTQKREEGFEQFFIMGGGGYNYRKYSPEKNTDEEKFISKQFNTFEEAKSYLKKIKSLDAKFSGYVNDTEVKFNSIKELKAYPYTEADKILIMGNKGDFFSSIKDIKEHVQKKTDKYGYSMNKKHKGMFGYYKKEEKKLDAKNFDYRKVLNKTSYQGRVMWNPKTGQILSGDESHSELLRQLLLDKKRDMNVNHWVRGIYMPKTKTFYVRHYFNPQSTYAEFTAKDFDISERMQKRFINKLRLPKDIKVEYNATNESLRQEGYIHV